MDDAPAAPGLDALLGHLLRRAHLLAQRRFAEAFDGIGLSPVQYALLSVLEAHPDIGHRALGEAVSTAPSVVTTTLKPLLADGLVRHGRDPGDARLRVYRLSASGRAALARSRRNLAASERELASALTGAETEALRDLLAKLIRGA